MVIKTLDLVYGMGLLGHNGLLHVLILDSGSPGLFDGWEEQDQSNTVLLFEF